MRWEYNSTYPLTAFFCQPIFLYRTVGLVWNGTLHIPLSKSRIQIVSAKCGLMAEFQFFHEACDFLLRFFPKHIQKPFNWIGVWIGNWIGVFHIRGNSFVQCHMQRLAGTPQMGRIHPRCLLELGLHSILPDALG